MEELCAGTDDLLTLSNDDVAAVSRRHGLARTSPDLLSGLLERAIERDVHRLIDVLRASRGTAMQPARLMADWAGRLGLPARAVAQIAADSAAPVALARAFLAVTRIDAPQRQVLEDMAAAYGAPPAAALGWIESAVNAEIDRLAESIRPQGSWWRRLVGPQPP
jgi:hypothetical protein